MSLTFNHGFAVITDEWGKVTAIPESDIRTVEQAAPPRSW